MIYRWVACYADRRPNSRVYADAGLIRRFCISVI